MFHTSGGVVSEGSLGQNPRVVEPAVTALRGYRGARLVAFRLASVFHTGVRALGPRCLSRNTMPRTRAGNAKELRSIPGAVAPMRSIRRLAAAAARLTRLALPKALVAQLEGQARAASLSCSSFSDTFQLLVQIRQRQRWLVTLRAAC